MASFFTSSSGAAAHSHPRPADDTPQTEPVWHVPPHVESAGSPHCCAPATPATSVNATTATRLRHLVMTNPPRLVATALHGRADATRVAKERSRTIADCASLEHYSAASGGPPVRATSSALMRSTFIPRARFVIVASSSSTGGSSPFMKRTGLMRAITKGRRYGLWK